MKRIIFSCFNQSDSEYSSYLEELLMLHEQYKSRHKIPILQDKEVEFINYMLTSYTNAQKMPTVDLFEQTFPETQGMFDPAVIPLLSLDDFRVYLYNMVNRKVNKQLGKNMLEITTKIESEGLSDNLMDRLSDMHKISNLNKTKDLQLGLDFKAIYEEKLSKPLGLQFNIPAIDTKIGGLNTGTLTTIAGFTSHFKTTMAVNMAYHNTYNSGYNLAYLTLETPKEDMYMNILCRHSYDPKFSKYGFIPHEKMRMCELTNEEKDYLYDVVDPDYKSDTMDDGQGGTCKRGRLILLDESDFVSMSTVEIYSLFEKLDEMLDGCLDGFIIDYIQLFKFVSGEYTGDDNRIVNAYTSAFRRMTQSFRSGARNKKLIGVILSQINRESWKKAVKTKGRYDLTCLADANELERGSHRVITTFTTEDMKVTKEASVQLLKNRNGRTMWDPEPVFADGEAYIFGDDLSASYGGSGGGFASPSTVISGSKLGDLFGNDSSGSGLGGLI